MRLLLVMWLAVGAAPGLGEVVETAVHLATSGHLAHSDADHGDLGDQGDEHGCGATQHHCNCCASQAVALGRAGAAPASSVVAAGLPAAPDALASLHEPAPPHRPPIGS